MILRDAVEADATEMGALYVRSWRETFPALVAGDVLMAMCPVQAAGRWTKAIASSAARSRSIVADASPGGIVGLSSFGSNRDGDLPYEGEIFALYVDTDHEGRGIGRALMAQTARIFLESGVRSCLSWVMTFSHTRFFSEAMGGRVVGRKLGRVGGMPVSLSAYAWDDLAASAAQWEGECAPTVDAAVRPGEDGFSDAA